MDSVLENAVETLLCVLPRRALADAAKDSPDVGKLTLTQVEARMDRDAVRIVLRGVLEQGQRLEDLHGENNPVLPFVRDIVRSLIDPCSAPQAPTDGAVNAR
ncbi:MAG: hypothetical protein G01um101425_281 [Candidatus Peregrinibacteria bacterium Gr01-1014_25]|nr:MAG: hypothetical protein G01um101425_281 [Candidatus Peregrinibacteria bacterium Gr01-1014_25]